MSIDSAHPATNVIRILFCDMLYTIPIFNNGFEDLTIKRKSMSLITIIGIDLSQINLDVHKYNWHLDAKLPTTLNFAMNLLPKFPYQALVLMPPM